MSDIYNMSNIHTDAVFLRNHKEESYLIEITKLSDNKELVDIIEYREIRQDAINVMTEVFQDWYKDTKYLGNNIKTARILYNMPIRGTNETIIYPVHDFIELYRRSKNQGSSN